MLDNAFGIEEKNLGDAIRLAGDHLYHVQLAENDRSKPGTGQLDWEGVREALDEIGYDRHVIIETFSQDNPLALIQKNNPGFEKPPITELE